MVVGTAFSVWTRGRSARLAFAAVAAIAAFLTVAAAFASSPAAIVSIATDTVTRGEPSTTVRLAQVDTSYVAGQECAFVLSSTNTHHRSLHDHTLILTIAGEPFELPIERREGEVSTGVITRKAGNVVTLDLRFGSDDVASAGIRVTMECAPPPTTTTTTTTTEAPVATTTTSTSSPTTTTTLPGPMTAVSPTAAATPAVVTTTTTMPPPPAPEPAPMTTLAPVPTGVPTGLG
jgi:hypothetical protein